MKRVKKQVQFCFACVMAACRPILGGLLFPGTGASLSAQRVCHHQRQRGDAFLKAIEERVADQADERDLYFTAKASRTAMRAF